MAVLDARVTRDRADGVEIAGTVWPVYKLEAIAAWFLTLVVLFAITGTAQTAVLGSAAVATLVWWVRLLQSRTTSAMSSNDLTPH